jgi:hypothetical protein
VSVGVEVVDVAAVLLSGLPHLPTVCACVRWLRRGGVVFLTPDPLRVFLSARLALTSGSAWVSAAAQPSTALAAMAAAVAASPVVDAR